MKGNNGTGNNIERDEWETPNSLFNPLFEQYGFNLDCCANEQNKKCIFWSDDFINADTSPKHIAWMNPPFSKAKEMFEHFFQSVHKGVAIYRCDNMETKIWQDVILKKASWLLIMNKRVNYVGLKGSSSRFPSAIIGLNVDKPVGLDGKFIKLDNETG